MKYGPEDARYQNSLKRLRCLWVEHRRQMFAEVSLGEGEGEGQLLDFNRNPHRVT